ncbi:NAD(P)H-hydrate dehydratase [Chitinimonas sp.]|uniref:NAD(P)H-hydrate dehydratase n=1 Tax=Chitinimonas sp. TaxID=1934313 RepID=UPI002F94E2DA
MYYPVKQLRNLERQHLAQGLPLMQRAGQAAADFVSQRFGSAAQLLVVAGPGNNGGDALVTARLLKQRGYTVHLLFRGEVDRLPADAAAAWREWQAAGGLVVDKIPPHPVTAVIDGGFGIGLNRPLDADWKTLIAAVNALQRPLLALDVPSGIAADSGARLGAAMHARWTLSFIGRARGLATGAARDHVGELHCDTLGLDLTTTPPPICCSRQLAAKTRLPRETDSHKGRFGTVAVLGGSAGMAGAALLAGRAALHAGAGKVLLGLLDPQAPSVDPLQAELMLGPAEPQRLAPADVLVVGPGLGPTGGPLLQWALDSDKPLVLDADALNLLAGAPELRHHLAVRAHPCLLTPHPSEAARLLGVDTAAVQADRYHAARSLASGLAATVLLKGAGSIVDDGHHTAVNPSGSAALANAGQGDVLSGLLGALLAQGLAPWQAANLGAWVHGAASDALVANDGRLVTPASEVLLAVDRLLGAQRA